MMLKTARDSKQFEWSYQLSSDSLQCLSASAKVPNKCTSSKSCLKWLSRKAWSLPTVVLMNALSLAIFKVSLSLKEYTMKYAISAPLYYEVCHLSPNTHLFLNLEEVIMVTFQLDISISFFKLWHPFARKGLIFGTVWHLTSTTDSEPSSSTSKASGDPPRKRRSAHTCTLTCSCSFPYAQQTSSEPLLHICCRAK